MFSMRIKSAAQPISEAQVLKIFVLFWVFLMLSSTPLFAQFYSWGAFRVETSPSGAQITIARTHQYIGESPTPAYAFTMDYTMGYYGFTMGKWFEIMISKPGYQNQMHTIFVPFAHRIQADAEKKPQTFMFVLRPMPQPPMYPYPYTYPAYNPYSTSKVEITSDPVGVSVFVDGQYIGQTPLVQNFNWMIGVLDKRTVVFEKSGYGSQQLTLEPYQKSIHGVLHPRPVRPHWF